MKIKEFVIGEDFILGDKIWRCTDIGTRVVVAIEIDPDQDPSWYDGPAYAVLEVVIDEFDMMVCEKRR